MKLDPCLYGIVLGFQLLLLLLDLGINACVGLIKFRNTVLLSVYLTQIICLIIAFIILLITFFDTYVCRAGLAEVLYRRFRCTVLICVIYLILTMVLNIWIIVVRWNQKYKNPDYAGVQLALFCIQRFWSPIYYYAYKRAALRISDPRFYTELDTLQRNKY